MDAMDGLKPQEVKLIYEVISALKLKERTYLNKNSDFCTEKFSAEFVSRLKIYHALNNDVLKKKTFEYAFANSLNACGRQATVSRSYVNPAEDVILDGVKFSLKTEASASISRSKIVISKLMEGRWIRECLTGKDFAEGAVAHVDFHLSQYQRVLILRAFKHLNEYEYRLVEVPLKLLRLVANIQPAAFSARTKNGSSRAPVFYENRHIFNLCFDGSVEKVTVNQLLESECIVHGTWWVPVPSVLEENVL